MEPDKSAIERAFELARTGRFLDVSEIKDRLRNEGYFTDTVTGPTLRTQLKAMIEAARSTRWKAPSRTSIVGTAVVAKARRARSPRAANSTVRA
jgi:hypothetical protein